MSGWLLPLCPAVTADDDLCDAELELNKLPAETDAGFGGIMKMHNENASDGGPTSRCSYCLVSLAKELRFVVCNFLPFDFGPYSSTPGTPVTSYRAHIR